MKYQFSSYDIGYPLYGAKFLNNSVLLVTGGGGYRNSDIPSKLTALRIDFKKKRVIKRFREITFDSKDDHPTTLDAAEVVNQDPLHNIILVGCNEDRSSSATTTNYHLRKFAYENDHLKFMVSADFNRSNNPNEFTKFSSLSSDGTVGAVASSKLPIVIRIIDPMTMEEKYEIETGSEVKDLHFSPDGKVICYITETTLEVISIVTGRFIVRKTDFNKNISLSKVRFLSNDMVVVVGSLKEKSKKFIISKINIKTKNAAVLLSKSIKSNYTSITAMDSSKDGQLICLATNEKTLLVLKGKDFTVLRSFKNIHQDDITAVAFSPDTQYIASVSLANTIYLVNLPPGLAESTSFLSKLFKLLLNILFTVGIIMVAYIAYYFELHDKTYRYVSDKYFLTKRDTSGYFQMHDGFLTTSMDIVDDVVTIRTLTGKINTGSDVDTKIWSTNIPIVSISTVHENKMFDKVENTFTAQPDVSIAMELDLSLEIESPTLLSGSNMYAKGSIPTSSTESDQSSESSVVETYTNLSNSAISSVSQSLQEMESSSVSDSKSRSGSTNGSQDSSQLNTSHLSSSTVSKEKMQPSSVLTSGSDSEESENTSTLIKRTLTVDGVVYEVISMSPVPTTSSFELSSKETSNIVSAEVLITDDLISKDPSGTSTTINIKSISTSIPNTISMISDFRNNSTSSSPVTQLTTNNDITFSNMVVSYDTGKEKFSVIKAEKVSLSSISISATTDTNSSTKVSLSEGNGDSSVSSTTFASFNTTVVDQELQSTRSHSTTEPITGIGTGEENNIVLTSVTSAVESSAVGSLSFDKIENLTIEETVTDSSLNTLSSKRIISTKLEDNTAIINKTESYTRSDASVSSPLENTSLVTYFNHKNDGHQSNSSTVKLGMSLSDNLLSTVSFISQTEIPTLNTHNDILMVSASDTIESELKNIAVSVNELSLNSNPEIVSSISQVTGSDVSPVNTLD